MEQIAMEVDNDNASDKKVDVQEHQSEKYNERKEENQGINELTEKCCDTKDEPLEINKHNSFDKNEYNEYVSSADLMQSHQIQSGPSYENTSGTEIFLESNDFIGHDLEAEQNFEFTYNQTENFDLSYDETNLFSPIFSDSLCMDSFSCSLYSTSLSNPSSISHFSCLPGTSNEVLNNSECFVQSKRRKSTSKINVTEEKVLTEEKASTSTEYGHIDNIDTVPEYIKTDIKFNDLLKCSHMITVPSNSKSNSLKSKNSFLSTNNFCKPQNKKSFNLQKNEKLFDATKNNINIDMSKFQSTSTFNKSVPNSVKSIGFDRESFQKIIDEFNENFDRESVYDNCSPFQNKSVNNNPDIGVAINCENYSDYPSSGPE